LYSVKKAILISLALLSVTACKNENAQNKEQENDNSVSITYPDTKKVDTVDTYFGVKVKDPYRWLEDDNSDETKEWVKEENEVTFAYLNKIPYQKTLRKKLKELWNYPKIGTPFKRGEYVYFYKNDGLQNQSVIYRYKKGEDPEDAEVFLDPNTFSKDATTSLSGMSFSEDGNLLAYSISEGGSDWRKVIVINTADKTQVGDTLNNIKFSGISWKGNEGFYYSSYDKPESDRLTAKTDQHKLYYHKLHTPQKKDRLIYGGTEAEKHRYIGG